jgi:predicted DNA-binding protein (MmcQ/YjbR family)
MRTRRNQQPRHHGKTVKLTSSSEGILLELRTLCLSLPETVERNSFGHPNFMAGKKVFVTFEQFSGRPSIAFRLDRHDIDRLSGDPQFFATPYGRGQWLSLWVDATFDWNVVEQLVITSYRLVALKRMLVALGGRA